MIICGDCKEIISMFDDNSIDAIITDPPAGISFMNKKWDHNKGGRDHWIAWMEGVSKECLRVIKPGGHALVWSIPRTSHWTAMAWENAGWECRDKIVHIFGTGFPKSLDISKAIESKILIGNSNKTSFKKLDGKKGITALGYSKIHADNDRPANYNDQEYNKTVNLTTDAAKQWNGWGTSLKPAHEDWLLFRKPVEGTIAQNVLKYETGGLNIDGCRVEFQKDEDAYEKGIARAASPRADIRGGGFHTGIDWSEKKIIVSSGMKPEGRFPANLILDDSPEVQALFPRSSVTGNRSIKNRTQQNPENTPFTRGVESPEYTDYGSAARFFYCAKASSQERNMGCENLPQKTPGECTDRIDGSAGLNSPRAGAGRTSGGKNDHPTVKSLSLMRYLCRLITPPNGVILDPFCGSGSTGIAAKMEGFGCIMIDSDEHSCDIAKARNAAVSM